MQNRGFCIEIIYEDPDMIEIRVSASNGVFCGEANIYLNKKGLSDAADLIRGFPSSCDDRRSLIWGAFGAEYAGGGVEISFSCADSVGHSYAEIRIETEWPSNGTAQSVLLTLPVEAGAVDDFVAGLVKMSIEDSVEARLRIAAVRGV